MAIGKLPKRAGVLMYGPSSEKKISLKSGRAVLKALRDSGLNATPVIIKSSSARENIRLIKSKKIDFAFIALHGKFGEDGGIQRILESIKMPYTGSGVKASRLAMDKVLSRKIFSGSGLHVPRSVVLKKGNIKTGRIEKLGFPVVVKPANHGSSIGLSIVKSPEEVKKAVKLALRYDNRVIVEEYIRGRELTVGIFREKALPVIEIIPKHAFFDYEAKYKKGLTDYIVPARINNKIAAKVKEKALIAHKTLGCFGCSRVDIILDNQDRPFILEINTIPGFTSTSLLPKAAKKAGIDFASLCAGLIRLAYEKKQG